MKKYPPKHHQEDDFKNIKRTIKTFPLSTLISVHKKDTCITHVPLIYVNDGSQFGKLVGHMDKNNPHCRLLDGRKIQVIFHGPDAYISPRYYSTEQLPTWNYIKVHIEGFCRINKSVDSVKQSIISMTEYLETTGDPYILEENNPRMNQLINYVVGFNIEILEWEGKFKLSQDKTEADGRGAKKALIESSKDNTEHFVSEIYEHHTSKNVKK